MQAVGEASRGESAAQNATAERGREVKDPLPRTPSAPAVRSVPRSFLLSLSFYHPPPQR
jgi:hypothetical protein